MAVGGGYLSFLLKNIPLTFFHALVIRIIQYFACFQTVILDKTSDSLGLGRAFLNSDFKWTHNALFYLGAIQSRLQTKYWVQMFIYVSVTEISRGKTNKQKNSNFLPIRCEKVFCSNYSEVTTQLKLCWVSHLLDEDLTIKYVLHCRTQWSYFSCFHHVFLFLSRRF